MKYREGNKRVVLAGHISLDITPVFKNSGGQKLLELFRPGKLLRVGKAQICTGGAVSNTGLGLHALGAEVLLMAKVGEDDFGWMLKEKIKQSGCESCIPAVPGESTSYTVVVAPRGLDRFFLHDPGCNDTFCCGDVDFEKVAGAAHFHFGYPTLMRRFYQNGGEELAELFRRVKELGLTTSLDLAAVDPDSEAAGCDWKHILASVLPYVDFFVPSIEELGYLLDRKIYDKWQEKAGTDDITSVLSLREDVAVLADQALKLGTRAVLLKCGAAGMYLKTAPKQAFADTLPLREEWGGISYFQNSFVPDRILSATGAGDTSIAAFIKAMLDGLGPVECIEFAAATGASCVTAYDAVSGLLPFDALKKKIQSGWKQQEIINP
ncbi:carbohydrate kinase family protein [Clostridium sp. Marseille-P2415]|uniref:carbohydrate kinase family protein n=1 Tax=Clostridium sp. Marseille-P2415 TaxID=1805471 RepID=UPI00098852CB|nr:carbohydrate kinase family protein [Clostridium sp. Marseille-P2415]